MILLEEVCLQLFPEYPFVEKVNHPDPAAGSLIFIGGTDSPTRRSNLKDLFSGHIDLPVIRKNEVGLFTDGQLGILPKISPFPQSLDLFNQCCQIQDYAASNHALF